MPVAVTPWRMAREHAVSTFRDGLLVLRWGAIAMAILIGVALVRGITYALTHAAMLLTR